MLTIHRILEGVRAKNLEATILFVDFSEAFDTIRRGKMEQILLTNGLPKETVAAMMMPYNNTKVKVRFPDGETDYFDLVAGVPQGDILAPYLFIVCLDFVLRTSIDIMKDNGFKLAKERSRRYLAQTIMDVDNTDYIAFSANSPAQAETPLHSLEWTGAGLGIHIHADKTEYIGFNQRRHLHIKGWAFETRGQVHLPRKQCLINRERHQHATIKGMDS